MSEALLECALFSTEEFLSEGNLHLADETVAEVFSMMLGLETEVKEDAPAGGDADPERVERTAIVGFSGTMRGYCGVRLATPAARLIASAMLGGAPIEEGDDSIDDAVGELCNMVAGGWKNRIPKLSSRCFLSPPTVISGCDYKIHMSTPWVKVARTYEFQEHLLVFTLQCELPNAA